MWPLLLDMTKDESIQSLRNLELEAYSILVSALRAQGPLNPDKRKLLKETGHALNITQERHKAEVRRALSDEKLNTIAYHASGQNEYSDDWAQEGRRVIPLMPRMAPQTAFSALADEVAENTDHNNKQLPLPANTERKRPPIIQSSQNISAENNKPSSFRVPDTPKHEENKKRKFSESSTLAQHLLGPSKISKIQQIYRQKTKSKTKEQFVKIKTDLDQQEILHNKVQHTIVSQKPSQTVKIPISTPVSTIPTSSSRVNIIHNINIQQSRPETPEDQVEQVQDINNFVIQKFNEQSHITAQPQQSNLNENITNRLKLMTKSNNNLMLKSLSTQTSTNLNLDLQKTLRICPSRKSITKTVPTTGQKLIVVSSAPTIPSSSILQRTLTIPFVKNISVKNFDKFKIVTTTAAPISLSTSIVNNSSFNSVKHKVVTVRTNNPAGTGKKIIPLTQLQMLNRGSIKVLPLGGKILGKSSTSTTPTSMYFMNTAGNMQTLTKTINNLPIVTATKVEENIDDSPTSVSPTPGLFDSNSTNNMDEIEINPSVVFSKAGVVPVPEDYDAKIDEFHIQTVPLSSQDTVIEEQCEHEIKPEDVENIEVDQNGMMCLPAVDCFISEGEIVDIPARVLNSNSPNRLSLEEMEVEIEEIPQGDNQNVYVGNELIELPEHKQIITDDSHTEN